MTNIKSTELPPRRYLRNDAIYDGMSRPGPRVVTFAPILKMGMFPLPEVPTLLMEMGEDGMGTPVEIAFAATLSTKPGQPHEFGVLQMRPLSLLSEAEALDVGPIEPGNFIAHSKRALGNGRIEGIRDLVVVDFQRFERARSRDAADEIGRLNGLLVSTQTPYILIGVGRWGSRDPWLGIPVTWDQVSGAKVIVEAGLRDFKVTPSQGSHLFQNLTAFNVGYFTVNPDLGEGSVDWEWLDSKRSSSGVLHRVDSSPENPRHDSPYFRSAVAEGSCRNSEQFECGAVRRSGPGF